MTPPDLVTVPILIGFDASKPVGELRIRRDALPPTPGFCFNLAIRALDPLDTPPGQVARRPYVGRYELDAVSIATDSEYARYLRQISATTYLVDLAQFGFALERCIASQEALAGGIDASQPSNPYASLLVREDVETLRAGLAWLHAVSDGTWLAIDARIALSLLDEAATLRDSDEQAARNLELRARELLRHGINTEETQP